MTAQVLPNAALELGEVTSVADPSSLNRVQVRFLSRGPEGGSLAWALVAAGFAGDRNGAFLIPDVGTRVVLSCLNGDPRYPVVLGAVWDGSTESPETLEGDAVDRWSFTGKAGTRIAMIEESGNSQIVLETAGGNRIEINDNGSSVTITQGGNEVKLDSGGIKLQSASAVEIEASTFRLTAASANFDTPLANFSALVMCQLLQTNTVVSATYTPGAGNML